MARLVSRESVQKPDKYYRSKVGAGLRCGRSVTRREATRVLFTARSTARKKHRPQRDGSTNPRTLRRTKLTFERALRG